MTYVLNSFSLYMLYRSNSHSHLKRLPWVAFPHRGPLSSSQLASPEPRMSGRLPLPPPPKYPPPPKNVLWIRWKFGRKCRHFFCRTKGGTQLSSHWKVSWNPWKSMFLVKFLSTSQKTSPQNVANWKGNGTPAISEKSRLVKYCSIWPDGDVLDEKKIILL